MIINAKDKFREGFIMLLRPFEFADLKNPIQKLTIVWAYSEQPIIKQILTEEAREEVYHIEETSGIGFFNKERKEKWIEVQLEKLFDDPSSYENLYKGDIVQCIIENKTCRFYPDEYKIMDKERIFEIMQEEGYHVIIPEEVKKLKDFRDKSHYLQSRGISKQIADKWTSLSFAPVVMYKPYYGLLQMFCRDYEIYPDKFYEEIGDLPQIEAKVEIKTKVKISRKAKKKLKAKQLLIKSNYE